MATSRIMPKYDGEICGLCGHTMTLRGCGFAAVWEGDRYLALCHESDHDCYHEWTVYGERPPNDEDAIAAGDLVVDRFRGSLKRLAR